MRVRLWRQSRTAWIEGSGHAFFAAAYHWRRIVLRVRDAAVVACCLIIVPLFASRAVAQGDAASSEQGRQSAETAIRGQLRRYVEAFNARDFDTLSALLNSRFEYRDETSGDQI